MRELIINKLENCVGCNRCLRQCPIDEANITRIDDDGQIVVEVDKDKCIACAVCLKTCHHGSRHLADDTERFFEDLAKGETISLIMAPAVKTIFDDWRNLLAWFRQLGVKKIYDVSLGADICTWAHIRYLQKNGMKPLISQPCPAIVNYILMYKNELIDKLSPIRSPMLCSAVYMQEHEKIEGKIAALSPCVSKAHEFQVTGRVQYNITLSRLTEYLSKNDVSFPLEQSGFDHYDSGLGSLFPMPGGLMENIEHYFGKSIRIDRAEGPLVVYKALDEYALKHESKLPLIFDVLNCAEGCNIGTGCNHDKDMFDINTTMNEMRQSVIGEDKSKYLDELYERFDRELDINDFIQAYEPIPVRTIHITSDDIEQAFVALDKHDEKARLYDCGACGCDTCYEMARLIAKGVSIPDNCIDKMHRDVKKEHNMANSLVSRLDLTIKATGIGLWEVRPVMNDIHHPDTEYIWTDDFRRLLGFEGEQDFPNVAASFNDRIHPDDLDRVTEAMENHVTDKTGQTPYDIEFRMAKKDGKYAFFHDYGKTDRRKDGIAKSFVGAMQDVTSVKNLIKEAETQKAEAEAANLAKSSFLSTMSHEIRTPMNAILGIVEIQLLQLSGKNNDYTDALDKIYTSGYMLLGIINDILDLSKIEAGKLELILGKYEIASLISDTAQLNMMRIGSKQIEFELEIDDDMPAYMHGDELRIKQILNNLLSNAFKYTKSGTVKLMISAKKKADDSDSSDIFDLIVGVSDTGEGMTKEQVDKLFDEFSRFNEEANRATEGTGLGMSITRNLVQLMDGHITVESEVGKGSLFTVTLPQRVPDDTPIGAELAASLREFRTSSRANMKRMQVSREPMPYGKVLIVDDVETNIYVAKGLLTPYELTISSVTSGFSAVDMVESGKEYDIIFMDHMMPGMDGIEATKRIRELGYAKPIVALTANAVAGQAEIFLSNGFDDFISKPIDIRQLNLVLNKQLRDKQPKEVVEQARKMAANKSPQSQEEQEQEQAAKDKADEKTTELFLKDAARSLATLDEIMAKGLPFSAEDLRMYVIHTHGMKSGLGIMKKMDLSAVALKLEELGLEENFDAIEAETPAFLDGLRAFINELTPSEEIETTAAEESEEDKLFLREKLIAIKDACDEFDETAIETALSELDDRQWAKPTKDLLKLIAEKLLHSDFDEIAEAIDEFIE